MNAQTSWALAALLLGASALPAQSTFGSIVGTVRDRSGATVGNVSLSLRDLDENTTRSTVSDGAGLYEFPNLKPGCYEGTASKEGFGVFKIRDITLDARQTVRVDFQLDLAPVQESVVVVATAPAINTENGIISDTKKFGQISQLPLNYRGASTSPLPNALFIVPGVQQDRLNRPSIGGGLPAQVEYTVDGVSNVFVCCSFPNADMYPSTEMLAEFKVTSVDNSAEFGQMGDVTVITKSGTNQVHGSALWFHQNRALDAATYGTVEKQAKVYNTFGGSLRSRK